MRNLKILLLLIILFLIFKQASAAHFIVGTINDSYDGTLADGKIITLWNPINQLDNLTDVIGPNGNSFANNFYMIDCELLSIPCEIGDVLSLKVFDDGDGYQTKIVNMTVADAGFDFVESILLNSPPKINYILVDDDISVPYGEIDLIAGGQRQVNCISEFYDSENDSINFVESKFFDSFSSYLSIDDNNNHYTNDSCYVYFNVTSNTTLINCSYSVNYYADSDSWNCVLNISDHFGIERYYSNTTFINRLLSFSVPNEINYGSLSSNSVSDEVIFNISNYGNSALNLSLYGYAVNINDNLSMNCSIGQNISIGYQKYNLTVSNPGNLNLNDFESKYKNLTSNSVINKFDLFSRQNDLLNDAINSSYWRIYVPMGAAGSCSGNIVFGAIQSEGI